MYFLSFQKMFEICIKFVLLTKQKLMRMIKLLDKILLVKCNISNIKCKALERTNLLKRTLFYNIVVRLIFVFNICTIRDSGLYYSKIKLLNKLNNLQLIICGSCLS